MNSREQLRNEKDTYGNLKTWLASRGFATVIKLVFELLLVLGSVEGSEATLCTLIELSSSSPLILGRRRAAILTLWVDIKASGKGSLGGGELTVRRLLNWLGGNEEQIETKFG